MRNYTFTGTKMTTKGINEDLPVRVTNYLWMLIENLKLQGNFPLDYLQVFELKPINVKENTVLSITHIQEMPDYKKIHLFESEIEVVGRIYVIDDIDIVTMLWAQEY